ncbi:MAG: TetR-like C-terminal domain-containing protein [Candidatus Promineifilaceae bacterium]|nr:TetR-like C-terminal domain-containing protein [Candidatus Promineifilaceae bacterium]
MAKKRRLNRTAVVEQAARMANAAGDPDAVTLTALAQALQVQTPSLYNHVAGLDDLRHALAAYGARQLIEALRAVTAGHIGRDALRAVAMTYREFAHQHPGLYPLTIRAPDLQQVELVALAQELLQMLLLILASCGLQGDEALHAVRGLRAVLHGFSSLEAAGGYKMALDRDESFDLLVTTYLDGLLSPE